MADAQSMLRRVRAALASYDRPAQESEAAADARETPARPESVGAPSLLERFESELQQVGGRAWRARSANELLALLAEILPASARIVCSRNPLIGLLGLERKLESLAYSVTAWPPVPDTSAGNERRFFEASFAADAGITGVDFALAESGSLVISSATEGSQLVSLAPPVHVALYRPSQLVATLEDVLDRSPVHAADGRAAGRSVVFITGTSRTADIEQVLIRGVHGPRQVVAILVEDGCLPEEPGASP